MKQIKDSKKINDNKMFEDFLADLLPQRTKEISIIMLSPARNIQQSQKKLLKENSIFIPI